MVDVLLCFTHMPIHAATRSTHVHSCSDTRRTRRKKTTLQCFVSVEGYHSLFSFSPIIHAPFFSWFLFGRDLNSIVIFHPNHSVVAFDGDEKNASNSKPKSTKSILIGKPLLLTNQVHDSFTTTPQTNCDAKWFPFVYVRSDFFSLIATFIGCYLHCAHIIFYCCLICVLWLFLSSISISILCIALKSVHLQIKPNKWRGHILFIHLFHALLLRCSRRFFRLVSKFFLRVNRRVINVLHTADLLTIFRRCVALLLHTHLLCDASHFFMFFLFCLLFVNKNTY